MKKFQAACIRQKVPPKCLDSALWQIEVEQVKATAEAEAGAEPEAEAVADKEPKEAEADATYKKAKLFFSNLPKKYLNTIVQQTFIAVTTNYTGGQLYFLNPENA